jgi:hypothetical protein
MLDEEEGWDLLIDGPPPVPQGRRYLPYGAAAGAGVALCAAATAINTQRAEEAAWAEARLLARAPGLRSYLARYPGGPHAAEARADLSRLYEAARARYLKRAGGSPGTAAVLALLDDLARAPSKEVWVRYAAQAELPSRPALRQREAALTAGLSAALQRALAPDLIALREDHGLRPRPPAGPGIDIAYRVASAGGPDPVTITWTLTLRTRGAPYTLTFNWDSSRARAEGPAHEHEAYEEELPHLRLLDAAVEDFLRRVTSELGLPLPPRFYPAADGLPDPRLSAEARRILRELSQRKNVSPQLLEEVDRLLRRKP